MSFSEEWRIEITLFKLIGMNYLPLLFCMHPLRNLRCTVYRNYLQTAYLRRFLCFTITVCTGANNRLCLRRFLCFTIAVYRSYLQTAYLRRFWYFTIAVCTGANNRLYVSDASCIFHCCVQELTTDASCILPLLCVQELTTDCMSQTLLMFYHCCVQELTTDCMSQTLLMFYHCCVQELTTDCMPQTLLMFYHCCVYRS